jgi:stress response protein YsnF
VAGTRRVKTGTVRVRKEVERVRKTVEGPVVRDVVRVTRVTLNRPIEAVPSLREEGDIL